MAVGNDDILQHNNLSSSTLSFIHFTPVPTVFVTGALTHVGHQLIPILRRRGYRVHSISPTVSGCDILLNLGCSRVTLGEEFCLQTLQNAASEATLFVHCAHSQSLQNNDGSSNQCGKVTGSVDGHFQAVFATRTVLTVCQKLSLRRLVVLAPCASPPLFRGKKPHPVDERSSSIRSPWGAQGRAMHAVEQLVIAANNPTSLTTVVIRPRLLWGGQRDPLTYALVSAARSRTLRLVDAGRAYTSTCHVANACDAVVRALRNGPGAQVYFVSDGEPMTYRTFIQHVLQAADVPNVESVLSKSYPLAIARRLARLFEWISRIAHIDPPLTEAGVCLMAAPFVVCDDKARQLLGYRGVISVQVGMMMLQKSLAMDEM